MVRYQIIGLVFHACYISLRKFQFIAEKGQGRYTEIVFMTAQIHTRMINHDFTPQRPFKIAIFESM